MVADMNKCHSNTSFESIIPFESKSKIPSLENPYAITFKNEKMKLPNVDVIYGYNSSTLLIYKKKNNVTMDNTTIHGANYM